MPCMANCERSDQKCGGNGGCIRARVSVCMWRTFQEIVFTCILYNR